MEIELIDKIIVSTILSPVCRYHDIDGAPFRIGDCVQILCNPNNDETFDETFSQHMGEVAYFEYDCGCGQTYPDDPMIGVKFANARFGEFWKEELAKV
jgi:hypothetical protein